MCGGCICPVLLFPMLEPAVWESPGQLWENQRRKLPSPLDRCSPAVPLEGKTVQTFSCRSDPSCGQERAGVGRGGWNDTSTASHAILPGLLLPSPPALGIPSGVCTGCLGRGLLSRGEQAGRAALLSEEEEEAKTGDQDSPLHLPVVPEPHRSSRQQLMHWPKISAKQHRRSPLRTQILGAHSYGKSKNSKVR